MTDITIQEAASQGDLDRVKALVMEDHGTNHDTSIVNERNIALEWACFSGHLPVVQFLVENGSEVNPENGSPLYSASQFGHIDVVQYLIEHGADLNFGEKSFGTPLHLSSKHGKESVVRYLVESKAKVNATTVDGDTPLHWACRYGHHSHLSTVQILVANGADTSIQNKKRSHTSLLCKKAASCKKWGHTDVVDYLESMEKVRQCHSLVLYSLVSTR